MHDFEADSRCRTQGDARGAERSKQLVVLVSPKAHEAALPDKEMSSICGARQEHSSFSSLVQVCRWENTTHKSKCVSMCVCVCSCAPHHASGSVSAATPPLDQNKYKFILTECNLFREKKKRSIFNANSMINIFNSATETRIPTRSQIITRAYEVSIQI